MALSPIKNANIEDFLAMVFEDKRESLADDEGLLFKIKVDVSAFDNLKMRRSYRFVTIIVTKFKNVFSIIASNSANIPTSDSHWANTSNHESGWKLDGFRKINEAIWLAFYDLDIPDRPLASCNVHCCFWPLDVLCKVVKVKHTKVSGNAEECLLLELVERT